MSTSKHADLGGDCRQQYDMKKYLIILMQCMILSCLSCIAKNLNPVADGIKLIDVTLGVGNLGNQIEKKERDQINLLKFSGAINSGSFGNGVSLNKKEEDLIGNLPNLQTLELELRPNAWGLYSNVDIHSTYPNVNNLVLDLYFDAIDTSIRPATFTELMEVIGLVQSYLPKIINQFSQNLPNLQTIVFSFGKPNGTNQDLDDGTYALILNHEYFNEKEMGKWGAHVKPTYGMVIFEKNNLPDYSTEPTIIADRANLRTNDVGNEFLITENIKYIGEDGFSFEKRPRLTIAPSNLPLYINYFVSDSETVINRPLIIGGEFHLGYKLPKITFKKPVVINTEFTGMQPQEIIFEDNVTTSLNAFDKLEDGIKRIKFGKIPTINGSSNINWEETIIDIPDGTLEQFVALGFPKKNINAISTAPISLVLEQPNTLLSNIQPDQLDNIEVLAITGFLYDTEIKILSSKCKRLKNLDLSKAIVTTSPETQKQRQTEAEFASALFGALSGMSETKYKEGEISSETVIHAKMLSTLADMDLKNVNKGIDDCGIPAYAFTDLQFLQSVKLPLTATYIGKMAFSNCPSLTQVELPPYLKSIGVGAFNKTRLSHVVLPATVETIGDHENYRCAFGHNPTLELLDAGNCSFIRYRWGVVWEDPLYNCKKLVLPKNTQRIDELYLQEGSELYCPPTLKEFNTEESYHHLIIYVQTKEAIPGSLHDCTIYVPEGGMTSWYAKYGDHNKIIEGTKERP